MSQTTVLKVAMSCCGCSGAVQRALGKIEESFDVNLKEQKVTVIGNVQPEAVFETVSKTGKKTAYWEEPVSAKAAEAPAAATEPAETVAPETAAAPPAVEAEVKTAEPVTVTVNAAA